MKALFKIAPIAILLMLSGCKENRPGAVDGTHPDDIDPTMENKTVPQRNAGMNGVESDTVNKSTDTTGTYGRSNKKS